MYKAALRCDIKPFEFWDYTIAEVVDLIESYNEKEKERLQFEAICGYNSSLIIVKEIRTMFSKEPHEVMQIDELYPTLFDGEKIKEQREIAEQIKREEELKARLLAYASAWNKKIRKE